MKVNLIQINIWIRLFNNGLLIDERTIQVSMDAGVIFSITDELTATVTDNTGNIANLQVQADNINLSLKNLNDGLFNTGINIEKGSKLCDKIVQVWEFEEGGTDITTVAKTFNNHTNENFFYDDNIEFTDDVCKVKDEFVLNNTLNDTTGLYETKLNKSDFIELISLTSEVIE